MMQNLLVEPHLVQQHSSVMQTCSHTTSHKTTVLVAIPVEDWKGPRGMLLAALQQPQLEAAGQVAAWVSILGQLILRHRAQKVHHPFPCSQPATWSALAVSSDCYSIETVLSAEVCPGSSHRSGRQVEQLAQS